MTLFSLAKRNVGGNLKNYLLYFLSMIFSVVIYYTFVSLRYSQEIAANMAKWEGMRSVFLQASFVLMLFAGAFIWYSNAFFTRKRKKEVGLYALLGVRKRTIGRMLFYENMLMGAGSIAIGIVLGALLSKLFAMVFLKLLDSPVEVSFRISPDAIVQTLLVFAAIILATSLHNFWLIYRFQLAELFRADREGEEMPQPSIYTAFIGVLLLGFAYWLVYQPMNTSSQMGRNMLMLLIGLIAGTYLLFRFGIIYILKLAQRMKSRYYAGMNMFSVSQLLYRIQGNTRMFTMIALLSAFTLCAVTVGSDSYYTLERNASTEAPFSFMYVKGDPAVEGKVAETLEADKTHPVTGELEIPVVKLTADLSGFYYHPSGFNKTEVPIKVMALSTYNAAAEVLNRSPQRALPDEGAILIRPMYSSFTDKEVLGNTITFGAQSSVGVQIERLVDGRVLPWGFPDLCLVVSDSRFASLGQTAHAKAVMYKAYTVKNQGSSKASTETLMGLKTKDNDFSSYYYQYRLNLESAGLNVFTLGFLGLVFLAATGCVVYFKQLTDAHADRERYAILRKIGVNRREIRASIAMQTAFVFVLPLLLGIMHSLMILRALTEIQLIGGESLVPITISIVAYVAIYIGYYVLCVNSYERIVKSAV
ncbi:ABC transporter permease [Paenibacillus whitsoniae]|uniref:ABC transporter permease n=1 Tax=Paenibacillus whitsoniae TaxID=2496558 RepID=A0A3S0BS98_9BACL|nr:ABC transporter permease [Paenibacillus whitsoniae]RTE06220.1 ABC transporter permease [Paenibacillus whitsoniae]